MIKKISTAAGFILLALSLFAQDAVVKKIIESGTNDNRTMQHLDILCNRFGGRLAGSDAYENAAEWAASQFKAWGMEVEMDSAGFVPVGFNRGPWFGKLLGENGMTLHFATPSYTAGTKGVQTGHVLAEPKNREEFDRMKGRLKGAWVLIGGKNEGWPVDYSERGNRHRDSIIALNVEIAKQNREIQKANEKNGEKKELLPLKEEPALFYREMKEAGILGIIQSSAVPIRVMYDRRNIDSMSWNRLPDLPDIKLDEHQYDIIAQMVKERRNFFLEFDIRNHFKPGPVTYYNVIGNIRGAKYPDELVIVGGHLDSYDVAAGGVDDGSGASVAMETARLLCQAGARPRRTIMTILFAAEEFGLLGSHAWVEKNRDKLPKISNMMNRDSGPLAAVGLFVPEAMWDDMKKICEPLVGLNPEFPFEMKKLEPRPKPAKAWGTDSGPFAVEGVPTMGFELKDVNGTNFSYGEIWHTERDSYSIYTETTARYQEHSALATAIVALGIANLNHLLSREGYYAPETK